MRASIIFCLFMHHIDLFEIYTHQILGIKRDKAVLFRINEAV